MDITRKFKVGGFVFSLVLESPWRVMKYAPQVLERIERASAGNEGIPTRPVRAGDDVPPKTFVSSRQELPEDMDRNTMDLSQYEPFSYEGPEKSLFCIRVKGRKEIPTESISGMDGARLIGRFDKDLPYYSIYSIPGKVVFEFEATPGKTTGVLFISDDFTSGEYYPHPDAGSYLTLAQVCTSSMILYSAMTSTMRAVLIHASVVRIDGKANVFLGASGTGKSTHSRLWLENIPGCDLINDDNPVLRFMDDGKLHVFGTPWSGKTPCYRNIDVEVRAIVRLKQGPENRISRLEGLWAYFELLPSGFSIKWDKELDTKISKTIERIAMEIPIWHLDCLPDADAARTCREATSSR